MVSIAQGYDWHNGGWGSAPKFPQPMLIEFLLRQASRGNQSSLKMATHALHAMQAWRDVRRPGGWIRPLQR